MSGNFTLEQIREIAGHSRQSVVLYTNYFYNIDGLEGIENCKTFEDVVDYNMPELFEKDEPEASVDEKPESSESGIIPFRKAI